MPDFTVKRFGTDTSGRGIFMTVFAWTVWQAVLAHPLVAPFAHKIVIVQGAFMGRNGGGALASAGYHDGAGCWDIRTWNLTLAETLTLIKVLRMFGVAAWRRTPAASMGGMDPHIHCVFGADKPLASGAAVQWRQYLANQSGLASGGRDYEWRPTPLVTSPPENLMQEDDMFSPEDRKTLNSIQRALGKFRQGSGERDRKILAALGETLDQLGELANDVADDATRQQVARTRKTLMDKLRQIEREDDDVDLPADDETQEV